MTNFTLSPLAKPYIWAALFALHSMPVLAATLSARVTDASGKPLADAVVFAEPLAGVPPSKAGQAVAIEQKDREFAPYVTVIQAGTSLTFPNRDPMRHHVYSFSPAKPFEIKLYSGDITREILFDKPGIVTLGCNIHDWMVGYVFVAETPYFAKTDKNGEAKLGDLPAGEYDLKVWHPTQRNSAAKKPQKLETNASIEAIFSVDAVPRKKKFKPPLDPLSY
ncbi:MAG: methylamine utilization protein [Burkholderiales bacterium]